MEGMNLEVTNSCPLHCPQCYCSLEGGKHLDLEVAKAKIKEGSEHGVKAVNISGGETLCYPFIFELVEYAAEYLENVNIALSGYKFNKEILAKLVKAGVNGIFISLNGSTKEINKLTRDGYELAINALNTLSECKFHNTYINWVMHSNNVDDFDNIVRLAERYNVKSLIVLVLKPDSNYELLTFPTAEQIYSIADKIKRYKGSVKIGVESCFSQLLAVIKDTKLFGNLNIGPTKGCRAGIYNYSINLEGKYSPCRHLDYPENFETLDEYLENSEIIKKIRNVENCISESCKMCYYKKHCRPCLAVNSKLKNEISLGNDKCMLWL